MLFKLESSTDSASSVDVPITGLSTRWVLGEGLIDILGVILVAFGTIFRGILGVGGMVQVDIARFIYILVNQFFPKNERAFIFK